MATIKDLIGMGPDELEKMTLEELKKHCEPYLKVAVVEAEDPSDKIVDLDMEGVQQATKQRRKQNKEDLMAQLQKLAKLHGVSLTDKTGIK